MIAGLEGGDGVESWVGKSASIGVDPRKSKARGTALSGAILAIRSKRIFEGARVRRRARLLPCMPSAPLLKGSLLCGSSCVGAQDQDVKEPVEKLKC